MPHRVCADEKMNERRMIMNNRSVTELVSSALSGDRTAYGTLFEMTYRKNHYFVLRALGDEKSALSVLERSYTQAFTTLSSLRQPAAFKQWLLLKTAQNTLELLKAQGIDFTDSFGLQEPFDDNLEFLPADYDATPGAVDFSVAMLDYLPKDECFIALLRYFCSMSIPAVSRLLDCSDSFVEKKLLAVRNAFVAQVSVEPYAAQGKFVLTRLLDSDCRSLDFDKKACVSVFDSAFSKVGSRADTDSLSVDDGTMPADDFIFKPTAPPQPIKLDTSSDLANEFENIERFERKHDSSRRMKKPQPRRSSASISERGRSVKGAYGGLESFFDRCREFLSSVTGKRIDNRMMTIITAGVIILLLLIIIIASAAGNKSDKKKKEEETATTIPLIVTTTVPSEITSPDGKYVWKSSKVLGAYTDIDYFNEESLVFKSPATGKYGLLDLEGNVLIEPQYDTFRHCSYGKAYYNSASYHYLAVSDNVDYLIDTSNWTVGNVHGTHSGTNEGENWYVPGGFEEIDRYFNGLAAAKKDGKWGYVDEDHNEVIPFEYSSTNEKSIDFWPTACDFCSPFSADGYAPVCKDGKFGIIDKDNAVIVQFDYDRIMPGSNGVFIAEKDGVWGFIGIGTSPKEPEG